ncbi:MAG: AsmA family protein [Steroidobacteraceae bacterium]
MRALEIIAFSIAALVALVAMVFLATWLLVDPNDYKDRIAASVQDSTGRELAMPGKIELSLFPWLALQIGPASLGNPPGFGSEPFAVVQRAELRVKLVPLLRKQVQIGRIEIEGLDLRLRKNAQGKGNWEDLGGQSDQSSSASQPIDLAGISIAKSRISYDDMVAQDIELDVGHVETGKPIAVKLKLALITKEGAAPMPVAGSFDVMPSASGEQFRLASLQLSGTLSPATPWQFAAPELDVDIAAQTLGAGTFEAHLASARIDGRLVGTHIIDAPDVRGDFTLQPVALRDLLMQLDIAVPVTRDANVLTKLTASGSFGYALDVASVQKVKVQLDDSAFAGNFALNLDTSAMNFDLSLDRIDLDRYLPPPTVPAAKNAKKEPFELPMAALKPLAAMGTLAIAQAKITGVALANLSVAIAAKDGVTRISPAKAQLYGGHYVGDIIIDARAPVPSVNIEQTMTGIDVALLLTDFAETKRLSGKGNVSTSLTARGQNGAALMKTLNGKANLTLADGAIGGVDIWFAIAQAQSLMQSRTLASTNNTGRTAFDSFKVSADIANGVATTRDLNIASQQLRVTGQGTANLATETVDYQVTATVLKAPPSADASVAVPTLVAIPVNITGTFDSLKVRADLKGIAKAKVKEEIDKRKDELQEKLEEKLKGLFGK